MLPHFAKPSRKGFSFFGLLITAAVLSACQTTGSTSPGATANATAPQPATAGPVTAEVVPAEVAQPAPQTAARPPQPVVTAPPINDNPNQLMGLDRDSLAALLGQPDLVRREKPAEIWQYVTADCVFDVVLYDSGPAYRVTYLEARNAAADRLEPRPCLNQVLRNRMAAPIS